jgi:hypothetical protein
MEEKVNLRRTLILCAAVLLSISLMLGQTSSPVRDPQAVAVVEQALVALGGKASHAQVRTAIMHGTQQVQGSQSGSFVWEDDLSGSVPEFRKEIRNGDSVRTFTSGHGSPARRREDDAVKKLAVQVSWAVPPLYLPGGGWLAEQLIRSNPKSPLTV